MMTQHEFAITYLNNIEKRHKAYFDAVGVGIMDCVKVQDSQKTSVTITYEALRPEIKHQIEMMFWDGS